MNAFWEYLRYFLKKLLLLHLSEDKSLAKSQTCNNLYGWMYMSSSTSSWSLWSMRCWYHLWPILPAQHLLREWERCTSNSQNLCSSYEPWKIPILAECCPRIKKTQQKVRPQPSIMQYKQQCRIKPKMMSSIQQ